MDWGIRPVADRPVSFVSKDGYDARTPIGDAYRTGLVRLFDRGIGETGVTGRYWNHIHRLRIGETSWYFSPPAWMDGDL